VYYLEVIEIKLLKLINHDICAEEKYEKPVKEGAVYHTELVLAQM